ncbi:2-hydroxyacid dehydrogenase [Belnapia sp. T18]|uniref:2-hydroxyacid dehydrogenase n=1 Tax=Belnapia arida TaxID=2804533 RepID=A0ABS1UA15_9PROT|nr:2-hydroxyacid dehydrogenase [Belnapia arida]MBL6081375.1 2-hydroxyacid dehydrogenase [Belnapia arida]
MKPVILTAMPLRPPFQARLEETYEVYGPLGQTIPGTLPEAARSAQALITLGSVGASAELMAALPRLGLITCYGTGFERVDRAEAAARGILVTHAGDANATSVAEFAMGLVLASTRLILRGDRVVRSGGWVDLGIGRMPLVPGLAGRRLGVYGLGAIGSRVAQRAAAFEMQVGYHNRSPRNGVPYPYFEDLLALARWADVLVVAARADEENRAAVGPAVLDALGRTGTLVNIARGSLVDEDALCDALEAGRIAGAGLDVYQREPHVGDRLKALDNVVLTPHMAALSEAAQTAQQQILLDNLEAFFADRPVRFQVSTLPAKA